jgi:hypothetical protein
VVVVRVRPDDEREELAVFGHLQEVALLQAVEKRRELPRPPDVDDDRSPAVVALAFGKQDQLQVAVADVEDPVDEVGRLDAAEEVPVLEEAGGEDRGSVPRSRAHSLAASRIALTSLRSSAGATAA